MTEAGFLLLGIAAGILSGLFGIGGGIVMVPSLIMFFGMGLLDANATSLAAMLLPVGALGVWSYYKAGLVNIRDSLWIAAGLLIGSFFGGEIAVHINESVLSKIYAGILLYVALSYFDLPALLKKKSTPKKVLDKKSSGPVWAFILVGLGAGIFAGLFGKGGGLIIVPVLIGLFHYDARAAAATSLAALQLPVGLPSVIIYAREGYLNVIAAALIAAGIVLGVFIGSKISIKLSSSVFRKVYAFFLLTVSVYMIYKYL